jgi:hypothetical protein
MSESFYISIISNFVTILIATGGWVFSYFVYRDAKKMADLERNTEKYANEIKARIALEGVACDWISELNSESAQSVKIKLRDRAESSVGIRPSMSGSNFR